MNHSRVRAELSGLHLEMHFREYPKIDEFIIVYMKERSLKKGGNLFMGLGV